MAIPLGPLREALAVARMAGPAAAKATKKTIRVLHNEGDFDSLTSMLKGKFDYNVRAIMDDMLHPSSRTSAGYANDGYPVTSMAKLPKGTITNRAGGGGMRARVMKLAQDQEAAAKARAFVPDSRPPGLKRIQDDLEFLRTNKPVARPAPAKRNVSAKSAAIAKRRAILKNMGTRK